MTARPRVLIGTTQTLESYGPPLGQPSAATVTLRTPAVDFEAAVNATRDQMSTTLSAAGAEGDESLTIASAAVVRGRYYLATTASGDLLPVRAKNEGTVTTFHLESPLQRAVASGAALKGAMVSLALSATQTEVKGECLARWSATIGGVVHIWDQPFDIVEAFQFYTMNPAKLFSAYPIMYRLSLPADLDLNEAIANTWDYNILPMLEAKGMHLNKIKSTHALEPVHAVGVLLHLLSMDESKPADFVAQWQERFEQQVERALARRTFWYDVSDELEIRDDVDEGDFGFLGITR